MQSRVESRRNVRKMRPLNSFHFNVQKIEGQERARTLSKFTFLLVNVMFPFIQSFHNYDITGGLRGASPNCCYTEVSELSLSTKRFEEGSMISSRRKKWGRRST